MKIASIIIMFLCMVPFLLLSIFSQHPKDKVDTRELEQGFYSVENDENINEVSLNAITDFEWEKAFLFSPYTSYESIEESLGVKYKSYFIHSTDEHYQLIFLDNDKVVASTELYYDPKLSIGKDYLTPSDDLVKIDRS